LTGTANQITASTSTGGITLSLPSTVAVNISGNAATATIAVNAGTATTAGNVTGIVSVANGGTGVNATTTAANQVFASPNGSTGAPGFRALAAADLPAPQNTRAICYVAGADNASGSVLTTSDTQKSFFNNLIGNMTITSAKCQVDAGSVTMNVQKNNLASAVTTSVACNSTPGTWQPLTVSGTSLALGDSLDLSISAVTTARRLTVCVAGTVN
jgi:trimeric autotransporter adhesin